MHVSNIIHTFYFKKKLAFKLRSMVHRILGVSWVMVGSVREEIWTWKSLCGRKKQSGLIPLSIFWIAWKKRNRKAFKEVEEFDTVRDGWYQRLGFLIIGNYLHTMENFGNLIEVLIDQ